MRDRSVVIYDSPFGDEVARYLSLRSDPVSAVFETCLDEWCPVQEIYRRSGETDRRVGWVSLREVDLSELFY